MEVIAPSSTTASEPVSADRTKLRRGTDVLLVVLFLAGLWLPLLGVRIGNRGWDIASRAENRSMAPEPTLLRLKAAHVTTIAGKLKALARFPGQFKYYLSDHFGFRSLLIRAHGTIMVEGLGVTSNPAVILGKWGWLYLANDNSLEDWRNIDPFTPQELEAWRRMLEARNDFCATRRIPYLFVVAPSKYDIYPEYMPDNLTRVRDECRFDQLLSYLSEKHSSVPVLDLRKPLLEAKKVTRVFQKTDTHWNDRGAWIADQAILEAVRQKVPAAGAVFANFQSVTIRRPGMDLAGLLGLNDVLTEESLELRPRIPLRLPHVEQNRVEPITIDAKQPGQPTIVMFRDSFMTSALPFLAETFGREVYLWEDGFDPAIIEAEHPDIVIQEIAQRKLMRPVSMMEKVEPVHLVNGKWELLQRYAAER